MLGPALFLLHQQKKVSESRPMKGSRNYPKKVVQTVNGDDSFKTTRNWDRVFNGKEHCFSPGAAMLKYQQLHGHGLNMSNPPSTF